MVTIKIRPIEILVAGFFAVVCIICTKIDVNKIIRG